MYKHTEEEVDPLTIIQYIDSFLLICHPVNPLGVSHVHIALLRINWKGRDRIFEA